MKKILLFGMFILLLLGISYSVYTAQKTKSQLSEIMLANIEALSRNESGGNTVDCYSSSESKRGASYYDCGTCTRQFNSKRTGNMRQCVAN